MKAHVSDEDAPPRGLVARLRATRKGFKPSDVEEPIDFYWHRPLAGLLVQELQAWPVTPNQVTIASGVVSFLAGLLVGIAGWFGPWLAVLGGVLLLVSIVLDCADGQLARIRGISSPIGRVLDGFVDIVAPLSVMPGLVVYLLRLGYPHAYVWPIGCLAAASLLWHAGAYDVQKNIYLHCSTPNFSLGGATLLTVADIRRFEAEHRANGELFYAFLMKVFAKWTLPQLGTLKPWLEEKRRPKNDVERELFRTMFKPRMAKMTWLGFGTHLFLLTLACWFAPVRGVSIWAAWFIMAIPMNALCLWVVSTQKTAERHYERCLSELRAAPSESARSLAPEPLTTPASP